MIHNDETEPFVKSPGKKTLKTIVLLPSKFTCCGSDITIRNWLSFPIMYTSQGTNVAASFNGNCKTCRKVYYYSYYENCPLPESDSNKYLKDQRRLYNDFAANLKYFQVSNKTMFETYLVKIGERYSLQCWNMCKLVRITLWSWCIQLCASRLT